ncbi:hypothetical protein POM88_025421 [Heracleum sosnowskyi]|uniref:Uncharacterized protein n=1 Tax=Heracleum sosnowskyi TaxID=360622 RepID=A0AAD8MMX0_9APIA|nr:hypothetical protein POM88_025421 [Heracleum sosnowskyi]
MVVGRAMWCFLDYYFRSDNHLPCSSKISNGIMLAIVMHLFDIGDHCIIDKEQVLVRRKVRTYLIQTKILLKPKRNSAGALIPPLSMKQSENVLSPDMPTMMTAPVTGQTPQTLKS